MMKNTWVRTLLISGLLLSSFFSTNQYTYAYTQNEAEQLIVAAEKSIIKTYIILSEAEKAGAYITPILNELNSVANRLNEAKINLNEGLSETIIEEIEATITLINDISIEVSQFKTLALSEKENVQRSIILYSFLKIIIFIAVMYGLWVYFKSLQSKRIMKYKPETI